MGLGSKEGGRVFPFDFIHFFKIIYLFIFREKGREGERGRETSMCGCLSCVLTTKLCRNPGMCSDRESNRQPFDSQPALNPPSYTGQGWLYMLLKYFHFINMEKIIIWNKNYYLLRRDKETGREIKFPNITWLVKQLAFEVQCIWLENLFSETPHYAVFF